MLQQQIRVNSDKMKPNIKGLQHMETLTEVSIMHICVIDLIIATKYGINRCSLENTVSQQKQIDHVPNSVDIDRVREKQDFN